MNALIKRKSGVFDITKVKHITIKLKGTLLKKMCVDLIPSEDSRERYVPTAKYGSVVSQSLQNVTSRGIDNCEEIIITP